MGRRRWSLGACLRFGGCRFFPVPVDELCGAQALEAIHGDLVSRLDTVVTQVRFTIRPENPNPLVNAAGRPDEIQIRLRVRSPENCARDRRLCGDRPLQWWTPGCRAGSRLPRHRAGLRAAAIRRWIAFGLDLWTGAAATRLDQAGFTQSREGARRQVASRMKIPGGHDLFALGRHMPGSEAAHRNAEIELPLAIPTKQSARRTLCVFRAPRVV